MAQQPRWHSAVTLNGAGVGDVFHLYPGGGSAHDYGDVHPLRGLEVPAQPSRHSDSECGRSDGHHPHFQRESIGSGRKRDAYSDRDRHRRRRRAAGWHGDLHGHDDRDSSWAAPAIGATGIAAVSTAALAYGAHAITAAYSGDAANGILGSTSAVLKQDVQTPSTTTLSSSANPSIFGDAVIFTVTVPTIGTVAATGTVNILEAGQTAPIGTVTLSGNPGTGTFTISTLPVGTATITAAYLGDSYYAPSNSPPVNQVVTLAQTTTTVAAVPNPGIAGEPVAITATVTLASGTPMTAGTVTFTDGTASLGTALL